MVREVRHTLQAIHFYMVRARDDWKIFSWLLGGIFLWDILQKKLWPRITVKFVSHFSFWCLKCGDAPLILLCWLCYNIGSDKNTSQYMPTLMSNQFARAFCEIAAKFLEVCKKCNSAAEWLQKLESLLSLKELSPHSTSLGCWASVLRYSASLYASSFLWLDDMLK